MYCALVASSRNIHVHGRRGESRPRSWSSLTFVDFFKMFRSEVTPLERTLGISGIKIEMSFEGVIGAAPCFHSSYCTYSVAIETRTTKIVLDGVFS
jgi:hypothetical protein